MKENSFYFSGGNVIFVTKIINHTQAVGINLSCSTLKEREYKQKNLNSGEFYISQIEKLLNKLPGDNPLVKKMSEVLSQKKDQLENQKKINSWTKKPHQPYNNHVRVG